MFVVNTTTGQVLDDEAVKTELAMVRPYGRWVAEHRVEIEDLKAKEQGVGSEFQVAGCGSNDAHSTHNSQPGTRNSHPVQLQLSLFQRQRAFGYTADELKMVLGPMAENGEEPAGSMGNDTPLAVLSNRPIVAERTMEFIYGMKTGTTTTNVPGANVAVGYQP